MGYLSPDKGNGYFIDMKRSFATRSLRQLCAGSLFLTLSFIHAQSLRAQSIDTTKHINNPEIIVTGFPASEEKTPAPVTKIGQTTIQHLSTIQEPPQLIRQTPSATSYSQSGLDIGYTYISLRGFDERRLSILVNGVPQNDPEDHTAYWIDMPDLLRSTQSIEVQRGAGSAFYGPPAIGGSINVQTALSPQKELSFETGYGSYNTRRYSVVANSGLFNDKYIVYAKLGNVSTDGYRHASDVDMNSYHLSIGRFDKDLTLQFNFYGGPFEDALNYYGVSKEMVKDAEQRKINYSESFTYERRPEERESFSQPHYEFLANWDINKSLTFASTLYYIQGNGYFDLDGTWAASAPSYYHLTEPYANLYHFTSIGNDDTLIRNELYRGFVGNKDWGWMPRFDIATSAGKLSIGTELRTHQSIHWGKLLTASELPADLPGDYHFYEYKGGKDVLSPYATFEYNAIPDLTILSSVQWVNQQYKFFDQKPFYLDTANAALTNATPGWKSYDFTVPFSFLNAKVGINYQLSALFNGFASLSETSREPRLGDYYYAESNTAEPNFLRRSDGTYDFSNPLIKPERLMDAELGFRALQQKISNDLSLSGSVTGYYMPFTNEIIKTGDIDVFGVERVGNADRTVHYGVELAAQLAIATLLNVDANVTLSHNEITEFSAYKSESPTQTVIGKVPIGFAPVTASLQLSSSPIAGLSIALAGRYVGTTYGDLLNTPDYTNDPYAVLDGFVTYRVPDVLGLSFIEARLQVNNLTNLYYATYASAATGFFVAAPRNYFGSIQIGL